MLTEVIDSEIMLTLGPLHPLDVVVDVVISVVVAPPRPTPLLRVGYPTRHPPRQAVKLDAGGTTLSLFHQPPLIATVRMCVSEGGCVCEGGWK